MVMQNVSGLGTILSIWAHPDDEVYLCGGNMAMATAAGSRVVCVTATRGELGVTDPVRWPPKRLAAIREAELAECLRILGVTEHRWLGYPDGGCAGLDPKQPTKQVADLLSDIRPDTVLTFAADGQTGHPDHIAVHHWTLEAVRRTGIGALHVSVNTQESLDQNLARFLEPGSLSGSNRGLGSTLSASSWIWNRPYSSGSWRPWPLKRAKPRLFAPRRGRTTTVRWSPPSGSVVWTRVERAVFLRGSSLLEALVVTRE